MRKLTAIITTGLVAAALASASLPANAAAMKTIIEDPLGDSNGINDQGTGDGSFGDFNQAGVGNVSDLVKVSLSNDAKNLIVLFEAQGVPPATQGLGYRLRVNPDGPGGTHCVLIEAFWPGATNIQTDVHAHVRDVCEGTEPVEVKILGAQLTIPRKTLKAFGKGATLKAPQAQSFVWTGDYPTGVAGPYMDTTKVGTDYKFKG
ncbi:MAG: hypothetical protein ACRDKT_17200 [Actinomycetota bacterium]